MRSTRIDEVGRWSSSDGGVHEAEAILDVLRGGFLDVLVTNEIAAMRLLELEAG